MRKGPGDFFENIEPLFGRGRRPGGPGFAGFTPSSRVARRVVVVVLVILAVLFFGPLLGIYTDWLWFRQLGFESLYTTRLGYQWGYGLVGTAVALVGLAVNIVIALRLR